MELLRQLLHEEPLAVDASRAMTSNRIIANFILYGALVYTAAQLLLVRSLGWRTVAPMAAALLMLVVLALLRRGRLRQASAALSFFVWLSMAGITILAGIDKSPGVTTFMVAVMTSALLLGIRAAALTTTLSLLLSVALYVLADMGIYRPPIALEPQLVALLNAGFLLLVGLLLVVSLNGLNDATRRARTSERRLRALLNALPDALLRVDGQGLVLEAFAQASAEADSRWTRLVGRRLAAALPQQAADDLLRLLQPDGPDQIELFLADGAAGPRRLETRASSSGAGEFLLLFRDVTELRATEAERARLARILDETPDFVGLADAEGHAVFLNRGGRTMSGIDDAPLNRRPISAFHPPDVARLLAEEGVPQALATGSWSGETRIRAADGSEIITSQVIMSHMNEEDGTRYLSTIARDISEQKAAEARQAHLVQRLQILAGIDRAIIEAHTLRDTIDSALRRLRDLMGFHRVVLTLFAPGADEADVFATSEDEIRVERLPLRHVKPWLAHLESGQPLLLTDMRTIDQPNPAEAAWIRQGVRALAILPLLYRRELLGTLNLGLAEVMRFSAEQLAFSRDVADHFAVAIQQARLNEQTARYAAELEQRVGEMERFTYTVSHDLKSPLITIQGFLGFLQRDVSQGKMERSAQDIGYIRDAAEHMQQLLDDLLLLSRIGRAANPPQRVALHDVALEAAGLIAGRPDAREVAIEIDPRLPLVLGDQSRLRELFQNLFENAVKFMGDQSAPRIVVGQRAESGQTIIFVADNGIGIAPRFHKKVFGLFEKLNPEVDGTGVGLALVKRIIEVHGGQIWVESEGAGKGSAFCFTLPETAADGPA